jgi:hypothetical protein
MVALFQVPTAHAPLQWPAEHVASHTRSRALLNSFAKGAISPPLLMSGSKQWPTVCNS